MNKNIVYIICYISAIFIWMFIFVELKKYFDFSNNIKIAIMLGGIGFLTFCLFKVINSKIKNVYQEVAKKFNGKVKRKNIFSSPEISFNYKHLPTVISYTPGGQYSPSTTYVKILTNFPQNIKIEICVEDGIYKSLKKLGLENPDIEINDKDFDKKFKLELSGKEKSFMDEILTLKIKNGFMYFFKKGPKLTINGGELMFSINDLPLEFEKLENYYSFAFHVVDHIGDLFNETTATN